MHNYFAFTQPVTSSLNQKLPYPHYSDNRFAYGKGETLIFDDGEKGDYNSYSDRFRSWDKEAYNRANESVKNFPNHQKHTTGLYWQTWLESYHDAPVTLHKIYACTDSGGYPVWAFNYNVLTTITHT